MRQNAATVHRHSLNSGGHVGRHEDNVLCTLEHEKQIVIRIEVHVRLRFHRAQPQIDLKQLLVPDKRRSRKNETQGTGASDVRDLDVVPLTSAINQQLDQV